jgi:hypothetical protein
MTRTTSALTEVEAATLAHQRRILVRGSAVGLAVMVAAWFVGPRTTAVTTFALPVAFVLVLGTYMRVSAVQRTVRGAPTSRGGSGAHAVVRRCPHCGASLNEIR